MTTKNYFVAEMYDGSYQFNTSDAWLWTTPGIRHHVSISVDSNATDTEILEKGKAMIDRLYKGGQR